LFSFKTKKRYFTEFHYIKGDRLGFDFSKWVKSEEGYGVIRKLLDSSLYKNLKNGSNS
jgi:hypothetical protein